MPALAWSRSTCIQKVDELDVFPAAATRVMDTARRPNATIQDMEEAVSLDPVLAARVLKLANSPLYGQRSRVGSLHRAITLLGFRDTRDIALALALSAVGGRTTSWGQDLWRHAMTVGWASKLLARHVRIRNGAPAFITGLLHDLGMQMMMHFRHEEMVQILAEHDRESTTLREAERRTFGVDHAALGGMVIKRWGLPNLVAAAVEFHHAPITMRREIPGRSVALLQIADTMGDGLQAGEGPQQIAWRARNHPATEWLHVVPAVYDVVAHDLLEHQAEIEEML